MAMIKKLKENISEKNLTKLEKEDVAKASNSDVLEDGNIHTTEDRKTVAREMEKAGKVEAAEMEKADKTENEKVTAEDTMVPSMDEVQIKKLGRIQFWVVLALFVGVGIITEAVTYFFGKTAGTVALCIIAVIISVFLYKDEILSIFSRKNR